MIAQICRRAFLHRLRQIICGFGILIKLSLSAKKTNKTTALFIEPREFLEENQPSLRARQAATVSPRRKALFQGLGAFPAAIAARAISPTYLRSPPLTPSPLPGSCTEWVASIITGVPFSAIIAIDLISTTRFP